MNQIQLGTTRLTSCLMALLSCQGKWFLPEVELPEDLDAAKLLQIRQEMEATGLVELDFDGKLHPSTEFARMSYNITHARGALRWVKDDRKRIYIRGPVDDLLLICHADSWTMELSRPSGVIEWMRDLALGDAGGAFSAMGPDGDASREIFPSTEADPPEALSSLLDIYFGGGSSDA